MDVPFPVLQIRSLVDDPENRGELSVAALAGLGRRLTETTFGTPAAPFLIAGWLPVGGIEPPGLFVTRETRPEAMAYWCSNVGARGYSSLLPVTPEELADGSGVTAADVPLLTGHGVVVASRGLEGEPLVGMDLSELRGELTESRRRLSELCGYPVRALFPEPTVTGRAFDGLVAREARRAGYTLLFGPGSVARLDGPELDTVVRYRDCQPGESAPELRDWLLGRGLSRESARIRQLASTPSAILDRLAPKSE